MVELVPDLFIAHRPSYTQSIRELDDDASDSSEPNLKELARVSGIEMNLNKNCRPSVQKTIIHPSMYPLYTPGCCWKRDNCYCYTYTVYMFCWFRHQFLMTEMKTTWLCWGGSFLDSRGTFQLSWDVTEVLPCRTTELQNLLTAVLRVLEGEGVKRWFELKILKGGSGKSLTLSIAASRSLWRIINLETEETNLRKNIMK